MARRLQAGAVERVRTRVRIPARRRRRPPWRRRLLLAFVVGSVALALDAVWVATSIERSLLDARAAMVRGAEALSAGDIETAAASFILARHSSQGALSALRHPAGLLVSVAPGLSDDVRAVRALAEASALGADAGTHLVTAAETLGWNREDGVLTGGGHIRLKPIAAAAPSLVAAAEALERARDLLPPSSGEDLLRQVGQGLDGAREQLSSSIGIVRTAADAATLLPPLLGGNEARRYLLAFQNLSDPRGSGGFLGMYGVLEADDGLLTLGGVHHVSGMEPVPPVRAPSAVRQRYAAFGALTHLHATTSPPDFPTAGRLALEVFRSATGQRLDGVVAADPIALAYLLDATGPVETGTWPEPISAGNAVEVFSRDVFLLPPERSDRKQAGLGEIVWRSVLENATDPLTMASAISSAAQERHLQVFARRPDEEALLDRLGASGRLVLGENPLLATWQGASPNRVGYFIERRVEYSAVVAANGSADVTVRVTTRNTAPDGPPSALLGDGTQGEPVGSLHAYVSVYLPQAAQHVRASVDGKQPAVQLVQRDFEHRVLTALVGTLAGGTTSLVVKYSVPQLIDPTSPTGRISIDVVPQPALQAATYSMEVSLPPGSRVTGASPAVETEDSSIRWSGAPTRPEVVWVEFSLGQGP